MAGADYRSCDKCGSKAFYDANLNYKVELRFEGQVEINGPYGYYLDYLGDWKVLCGTCCKTHKCVIIPIEEAQHEKE